MTVGSGMVSSITQNVTSNLDSTVTLKQSAILMSHWKSAILGQTAPVRKPHTDCTKALAIARYHIHSSLSYGTAGNLTATGIDIDTIKMGETPLSGHLHVLASSLHKLDSAKKAQPHAADTRVMQWTSARSPLQSNSWHCRYIDSYGTFFEGHKKSQPCRRL